MEKKIKSNEILPKLHLKNAFYNSNTDQKHRLVC